MSRFFFDEINHTPIHKQDIREINICGVIESYSVKTGMLDIFKY